MKLIDLIKNKSVEYRKIIIGNCLNYSVDLNSYNEVFTDDSVTWSYEDKAVNVVISPVAEVDHHHTVTLTFNCDDARDLFSNFHFALQHMLDQQYLANGAINEYERFIELIKKNNFDQFVEVPGPFGNTIPKKFTMRRKNLVPSLQYYISNKDNTSRSSNFVGHDTDFVFGYFKTRYSEEQNTEYTNIVLAYNAEILSIYYPEYSLDTSQAPNFRVIKKA